MSLLIADLLPDTYKRVVDLLVDASTLNVEDVEDTLKMVVNEDNYTRTVTEINDIIKAVPTQHNKVNLLLGLGSGATDLDLFMAKVLMLLPAQDLAALHEDLVKDN